MSRSGCASKVRSRPGPAVVRDFLTGLLRRDPDQGPEHNGHDEILSGRPTDAATRIQEWDGFRGGLEERGLLDLAMGYFV